MFIFLSLKPQLPLEHKEIKKDTYDTYKQCVILYGYPILSNVLEPNFFIVVI